MQILFCRDQHIIYQAPGLIHTLQKKFQMGGGDPTSAESQKALQWLRR